MYEALQELLDRQNQTFVCVDTGWPEPGPERHIASITHEVEPPLDESTLTSLREQLGDLPEVLEFYRRWGGVRLYCDTVSSEHIGRASAFFIGHPDIWPELKESFSVWLEDLDEDETEELLPGWLNESVVFGEVPNSGNSFLLSLSGATAGRVFEFEHDGFEFVERGRSFAEFLESLATVNDALLAEIRGHTRYSDGSSEVQWMCVEYAFDEADA